MGAGAPVFDGEPAALGGGHVSSGVNVFDAAGVEGCSGSMPNGCSATCSPLWSSTAGAPVETQVTVAHGSVYVSRTDGSLTAYRVSV
ncbi:MAG TPA: PQQ-binding-like beta-propeller repeat protein [Acidimicrobiia bacterium]